MSWITILGELGGGFWKVEVDHFDSNEWVSAENKKHDMLDINIRLFGQRTRHIYWTLAFIKDSQSSLARTSCNCQQDTSHHPQQSKRYMQAYSSRSCWFHSCASNCCETTPRSASSLSVPDIHTQSAQLWLLRCAPLWLREAPSNPQTLAANHHSWSGAVSAAPSSETLQWRRDIRSQVWHLQVHIRTSMHWENLWSWHICSDAEWSDHWYRWLWWWADSVWCAGCCNLGISWWSSWVMSESACWRLTSFDRCRNSGAQYAVQMNQWR